MKKHVFSRFFMDSFGKKYTLSELAQYMAVFYFDMRNAHFHTAGKDFLELHEYAQELYEQAEDYYDDLIETAISFNETVQPMFVTPGNYSPVTDVTNMTPTDTIGVMLNSVRSIYDYFESINREIYPSFVYSKIDSMLEWLDKQNYKLTQMSKEIPNYEN